VSVGHIARAIEAVGIPTVSVYVEAFLPAAKWQSTPRVAFTRFPMGRPLGAPGNRELQIQVIKAALELLNLNTTANPEDKNIMVELPFEWQTELKNS
jgi:hypothetical protein